MPAPKKNLLAGLSFVTATVIVCIFNFLLQVVFIFIDLVSRVSSSSAYVIALWLVTGVFGVVFTYSCAEQFLGREYNHNQVTSRTVIFISVLAIILAVAMLVSGNFRNRPEEYSLLLSSGYVCIAYFTGAAAMAFITRKLK